MFSSGRTAESKKESKNKVTEPHQIGERTIADNFCSTYCILCSKQVHPIYIDTDVFIERYAITIRGSKYRISNPTFRILCAFNEHKGKTLSRAFLLVYGWGIDNKVNNNVTVAISELRALLKNKSNLEIITIHGKGYQLFNQNKSIFKV
jgi:DNA-binding winged helix-turn-helix (wHTH) protein